MINRFTLNPIWLLMAAAIFMALNLSAKTLILPIEAITDSGTLSAEDFRKKYPGIDVTGSVPSEEGFYVHYAHGNLNYYFGPLDDYGEALEKKLELGEIREAVLYEAPELGDGTIEIFEYSYEMFSEANAPGAEGEEGSMPGQSGESDAPWENSPEGDTIGAQPGESGQKIGQIGQQGQAGSQQQAGFPQFPQSSQNSQQGGSPSNQQGQQGQRSIFPMPSQSGGGGPPIPSQGGGGGGPPIPGGSGESGPPSPSQGGGIPIWQLIRKILWGR